MVLSKHTWFVPRPSNHWIYTAREERDKQQHLQEMDQRSAWSCWRQVMANESLTLAAPYRSQLRRESEPLQPHSCSSISMYSLSSHYMLNSPQSF
jgi:hypothetical protein